jgi:hypothetical protein
MRARRRNPEENRHGEKREPREHQGSRRASGVGGRARGDQNYRILRADGELKSPASDTRARIESFERGIKYFFLSCETDLSPEECARFRRRAQVAIEDLFGRIDIDRRPYKPRD